MIPTSQFPASLAEYIIDQVQRIFYMSRVVFIPPYKQLGWPATWCRVAYMRWLSYVAHGPSPEVYLCHAGVHGSDNGASYAASQSAGNAFVFVDLF